MTHPLVTMLDSIARKEAAIADDRNDRREGYCDGLAGHFQDTRSATYREAREDRAYDRMMMHMVAEWKRRAALPEGV